MKRFYRCNEYSIKNRFQNAAERLMKLLPDWLTGDSGEMKKKYSVRYGARDYAKLIQENKTHTMKRYLVITIVFTALTAAAIAGQLVPKDEIREIRRPEYDENAKSIPVEVQLKYKDYNYTEKLVIKVPKKELDGKEKLELLRMYKERLKDLILGENKDLDHINQPLNLIDRDTDFGITIEWTSDQPEFINERGEVDLVNASDHQSVELQAEMTLDDVTLREVYPVQLSTDYKQEDYKRSIDIRLDEQISQAAENDNKSTMILPNDLGNGIKARWFRGRENKAAFLFIAFLFLILGVYFKRYDRIDGEIRKAEESISRDLPEFINKLVLLLNAGLVVSTAFSKIVEDYESFHDKEKIGKGSRKDRKYLYEELAEIQKRVDQSNVSLINELRDFSQRSRVREMIRLTAVISDNWKKGSTLAEKLESEGELLWINRKRKAEEKGKLAETKLTFPLMILLIVLIMITIAPAMLQM